MSPEMNKALEMVLGAVEKKYGKGSIMSLDAEAAIDPANIINSGSIALDTALGIGGYRKGRMIEIWGDAGAGKTTISLHAIAEAQKAGGTCAFVDAEHALDVLYAKSLDVDADKLLVSQPDYGEQALEITDMLARSGVIDLIVIDSVAALTPKAELEGEMGDHHIGLQARLMSQAMRKLASTISNSNTAIMFINQTRIKIGVLWGSPITTSGGNSLKFYASQRLKISRIGKIEEGGRNIGNKTRVEVVKNKLAPPFRIAEFDIRFGIGIDKLGEMVDIGVEDSVIQKAGAWYSFGDTRIGQGRQNTIEFLRENQEVYDAISKEILEGRGLA